MPQPPRYEEKTQPFDYECYWEKTVADYCGIPIHEVFDMPYEDFLAMRRAAFISSMSRTEEGREWLTDSWYMEQTEPDYEGLRRFAINNRKG